MYLIYIEPRNNPYYFYYQVLSDINTNFSAITDTIAFLSGGSGSFLPLSGGTLTGGITGTSLNMSGPIMSASTDLNTIFLSPYDIMDGGSF